MFGNKNKYHAVKTTILGRTFDSKKESADYCDLLMREKAGEISGLECQKKFQIIPKTKTERAAYYVADFVYHDVLKNKNIIQDSKSAITKKNPVYILKRKLIKYLYPEYEFIET